MVMDWGKPYCILRYGWCKHYNFSMNEEYSISGEISKPTSKQSGEIEVSVDKMKELAK